MGVTVRPRAMLDLYVRSMEDGRPRLDVGSGTTLAEVQAQLQVRHRDAPVKTCPATQGCPHVPPVMARWLRGNLPANISDFPSTSITVNFANSNNLFFNS